MNHKKLLEELKRVAPSVAFTVSKSEDESFRWDGDGPDPRKRGIYPYNVTVTASAVIGGEIKEGNSYLGGSYYRRDEKCGDVHGYLPQMLEEAAEELAAMAADEPSLALAVKFLKQEMRARYDEQMTPA